ncbi:PREDICTED: uncharacterized protein LOC109583473 [Amphimedon queenslandica]|uniref:Glucose-methanol-choline oxidoreductase C-terminal domain-containing protein n=1 Tax=Amphimedon queenslandica TaxID=400682 RepID=A0A1X7UFS0_AMPQE|nr:PREDICTED: uncharacterized protein LOC109583473 [Amphimedon queenslandica]|eukprot:XP_019854411.1 PREDICTED: uncharacterized protein LOC109583473 [Amphimedon queenslandica]
MASGESVRGYPGPSITRCVSGTDLLDENFFLSKKEWDKARVSKEFDQIVIGSSFCALSFIKRALANNPNTKILVLEQGHLFLQEHFQNLPSHYKKTVGDSIENFPWSLTDETWNGKHGKLFVRGTINYFGGRSCVWSGWIPEPSHDELEGWPEEIKERIFRHFKEAVEFLHVVPADEIGAGNEKRPIYGELQERMGELLKEKLKDDEHMISSDPAPLAVGAGRCRNENFHKFSVPEALIDLSLKGKIKMVSGCNVKLIRHDGKSKALSLETSRGDVEIGDANLILAMGVLPGTTLVLNSFSKEEFPRLSKVGEKFSAHIISGVTARMPVESLIATPREDLLEIGAMYIKGRHLKQQFHFQLTAIHDSNPEDPAHIHKRHHYMPGRFTSADECLKSSEKYVVFKCAALGELDHANEDNWYRLKDGEEDKTSNISLQVVPNAKDGELLKAMEKSVFRVFEALSESPDEIEYIHEIDGEQKEWRRGKPTNILTGSLVHESSTMWIGRDDSESPVGLDYRPKGVENVYITGGSLWPTGGSWNPTGAIVALTMDLADQICPKIVSKI